MKTNLNEIIFREVCKITHTWKKFGNEWLIIGGICVLIKKN